MPSPHAHESLSHIPHSSPPLPSLFALSSQTRLPRQKFGPGQAVGRLSQGGTQTDLRARLYLGGGACLGDTLLHGWLRPWDHPRESLSHSFHSKALAFARTFPETEIRAWSGGAREPGRPTAGGGSGRKRARWGR